MRRFLLVILAALALGVGLGLGTRLFARREKPVPDPPALVVQIRDIARLETLEVSLYKKVTFRPDPTAADSFWGDVKGWIHHTFTTPQGKAIVFADARLGLDLDKLGPQSLEVKNRTAYVVLPEVKVTVELKPGETEVIGSNLDSAETFHLAELAKNAFEREVAADPKLRARARASAERAVTGLLLGLGFEEVRFVDALPRTPGS